MTEELTEQKKVTSTEQAVPTPTQENTEIDVPEKALPAVSSAQVEQKEIITPEISSGTIPQGNEMHEYSPYEARIICHKCKSENSPTALRCQNCDANLLPSESFGQRLASFIGLLAGSAALGYLFYRFYIQQPGTAPDFVLCNMGALGGGAIICFITAFVMLLRKTPIHTKYENRAKRHLDLNAWQALDDFNHALDLAPEKEHAGLIKQRAKVYEKLGLIDEAARDHLTLAVSPDAYKGEGEWISALSGADGDMFSSSMRSSRIKAMLHSGNVKAIGYCRQCKDVVELNEDQRCLLHPKTKGTDVEFVIPADILAGKLAVMQKLEHRHKQLAVAVTDLLIGRQARAIGYCPRCKAAVQLDSARHCLVHSKTKGKKVQYVVPGNEAEAKRVILQWRRMAVAVNRQRTLMIVGLVVAVMVILQVFFPDMIKNFITLLGNALP